MRLCPNDRDLGCVVSIESKLVSPQARMPIENLQLIIQPETTPVPEDEYKDTGLVDISWHCQPSSRHPKSQTTHVHLGRLTLILSAAPPAPFQVPRSGFHQTKSQIT